MALDLTFLLDSKLHHDSGLVAFTGEGGGIPK